MPLFFILANSQTVSKQASSIKFQSNLQSGILIGESYTSPAFTISAINGIQCGSWFTGIGIGIDYYALRSVPLFFDVKKNLSKKANTSFLFADVGYNFYRPNYHQAYTTGGLYYEAGVGYKFSLKNKMGLGFSAGYSVKTIKGYGPIDYFETPTYEYKFRRVSIKLNWWLK